MRQKRCAIYTRKSVEEGLEQEFNSLDAQRSRCKSYISSQKQNGWVCSPKHYDDGGWSGGNIDRPGFKQLMEDIESGLIEVVVVYKLDRLSRSLLDFVEINRYFDQHDIGFVSVTQEINTNTSSGRMLLNLLMTFAQYEREANSERVRDKIAESRRMGKYCSGTTPYGYKRNQETRRLEIEPVEANVVRWIFRQYLKLSSCYLVALALNQRGIKTRYWKSRNGIEYGKKEWKAGNIRSIITSPIYVGLVPYKKEMFPGEHDPLIKRNLWDRIQEILALHNRGTRTKHLRHRQSTVLTSLLKCGKCNCALTPTYTNKGKKRYFYYVCQKTMKYPDHVCSLRKIAAPEIEPLICYQLSMIFQTYTMREEIINETDICWREYCRKLVKERSATRQTLKYAKEKSAQQVLEEKIECLTQRFKSFQKGISRQRIDRSIADFNLLWNAMTPPNKINLLDAIVEQIRVYPDKIQTILSVELTELKSEIASRLRYNGSLSSIYLENDRLVFEMPISQKRLNG